MTSIQRTRESVESVAAIRDKDAGLPSPYSLRRGDKIVIAHLLAACTPARSATKWCEATMSRQPGVPT